MRYNPLYSTLEGTWYHTGHGHCLHSEEVVGHIVLVVSHVHHHIQSEVDEPCIQFQLLSLLR